MNTKALHWLFFYFLVFADLSIQAQSFQVTPLSEKSGLLHAQINDIFEDASGLLWIASDQGLFRYNGRQFKLLDRGRYHKFVNYGPAESIAVADNKVTLLTSGTLDSLAFQALRSVGIVYDAVSSEAGASLWVLSETGVYCFKDRKLTRQTPEGFAEGYRQSLFIAEGEIIQILSPTGTLYRMKAGHTRFERRSLATTINAPTQYLRYNDSILFFIDSHKVFELHSQSVVTPSWVGLPEDIEITTIDTLSHQIMLGSQQHGLWLGKRTGENFTFTRVFDGNEPHRLIDLPFQQIDNIHCSLHDNVWLLERGRLWLLRKRPFKRLSQSVPMSSFEQLVFMGDGKIYIDSENGLFECQRTAETEFSGRPSGIRLERLQTAIAGHGKRLWIATVDGQILYYEDEKIVNVADLGDRGGIIFNIYADPAHDLWVMQAPTNEPIVGTLRITKDGKVKEYGEAEGFHSRMLIAKDSPYGVLYCAGIGERSYLYRYDDEHDRFVNLSAEMKFDHGENFEVHDLAISEDSTIWLASTAGLLRYKHGAIEKMYSDELYDNEAYAVTIGHEGSIWFSTDTKGVARYKDGEYAFFDLRAGLASNFLTYRSILCTANETIWLGTREGVYISIPEFR
ncbi:MAG: ligand-binding sensor domain-containing protein, partial [Bacteroidota bacterium]